MGSPIGLISFTSIFVRYTEETEGPYTLYELIYAEYLGLMCVSFFPRTTRNLCLSNIVALSCKLCASLTIHSLSSPWFPHNQHLFCFLCCVAICCAYLTITLWNCSVCPIWECLIRCLFFFASFLRSQFLKLDSEMSCHCLFFPVMFSNILAAYTELFLLHVVSWFLCVSV